MKECLICYDEKKSFKYLSCKHGLCTDCYNKISNSCPFCRTKFNKIIIIKNIPQKNNKIIIDEYLEHRNFIKKKYKYKYNVRR